MSAAHTPGPWEYEDGYVQPVGVPDLGIAHLMNMDAGGSKDWFRGPVTLANARLIAAAPTTAEQAMAFTFIVERFMRGDHPQGVKPATEAEVAEAMYELRNHIAKATGSQA